MRCIVQDMTERLRADLHEEDLYMCLGAKDLAAWDAVLRGAGPALAVSQGPAEALAVPFSADALGGGW